MKAAICGSGGGGGNSGGQKHEIERLSRDDSILSFSAGILPSLGARSHRRAKLRRSIISPFDPYYRYNFINLYKILKSGFD